MMMVIGFVVVKWGRYGCLAGIAMLGSCCLLLVVSKYLTHVEFVAKVNEVDNLLMVDFDLLKSKLIPQAYPGFCLSLFDGNLLVTVLFLTVIVA
jgi:hypothetical protein